MKEGIDEGIREKIRDPIYYISNFLKVINKRNELVKMKLWKAQEYYIRNRTKKDIILKNRQIGMSTGVLAGNSHIIFTEPYQRVAIITHDEETSRYLLMTVKRFLDNLPEVMRPEAPWSSREHLQFKKLDSYIYIDSAKSDSIGIGHTLSICHLSEVAKWPHNRAKQLFADITPAIVNGWVTIESTPKGRVGMFYDLYLGAKRGENEYKPFFFPWWWDESCYKECPEPLEYTKEEKELIEYAFRVDEMQLGPGHIKFRRDMIALLGDLFYQEYPENDTDCWLANEMGAFDPVSLRIYLQGCWDGKQEGNLTIWKDVLGGEKYVIGADTSGGHEQGDYAVAAVLNVRTNEYVARLRGKIPPDLFAEQLARLGKRYNDAEIAVERTSHGYVVLKSLLEANYPNLYYHQEYDEILKEWKPLEAGWKTSKKSKPIMMDELITAVRAHDIMVWSRNFVDEASGLFIVGQEKYIPSGGGYDDEVDALAIAYQIRSTIPVEDEKMERKRASSYISL